MNLKSIKLLGGIGVIGLLLGMVPVIGSLFGVVGVVLVLIALWNLSKRYPNGGIFSRYLLGMVIPLMGMVLGGVVLMVTVMSSSGELAEMESLALTELEWEQVAMLPVIIGSGLIYLSTVLGGWYQMKSLEAVALQTGHLIFRTAGQWMFWGGVLLIIGIGLIAILIGLIMVAVAFFTLPEGAAAVDSAPVAE